MVVSYLKIMKMLDKMLLKLARFSSVMIV